KVDQEISPDLVWSLRFPSALCCRFNSGREHQATGQERHHKFSNAVSRNLLFTFSRKRQRTAALQDAIALAETLKIAAASWSAAVLCRFGSPGRRRAIPRHFTQNMERP